MRDTDIEGKARRAAWRARVNTAVRAREGIRWASGSGAVREAIESAYAAGWEDGKWWAWEEQADSEQPDGPPTSDPEELIARLRENP